MLFLAVDDENLQLNKLVDALKKADPNSEILSFNNPLIALEAVKNVKIDVAFLDIEMGGINGVELGKRLKSINPNINIIFVTGYDQYALDAYSMHASGYLTKPVSVEKLKMELSNLRYTMPSMDDFNKLKVQCFGHFEVFYNGNPVKFSRSKTKEMLAFLIDRKGSMVSVKELSLALFGEEKGSYIRNLVADLSKALKEINCEDVFIKHFNSYGIKISAISCDYYDYLNNVPYAVKAYNGVYMQQYSWEKLATF